VTSFRLSERRLSKARERPHSPDIESLVLQIRRNEKNRDGQESTRSAKKVLGIALCSPARHSQTAGRGPKKNQIACRTRSPEGPMIPGVGKWGGDTILGVTGGGGKGHATT